MVLGLLLATAVLVPQPPAAAVPDPEWILGEGLKAIEAGNYTEAVDMLETALSVDPNLRGVRVPLARCYHELGQTAGAIQHLQIFLASSPPGEKYDEAQALLTEYAAILQAQAHEKEPAKTPVKKPANTTGASVAATVTKKQRTPPLPKPTLPPPAWLLQSQVSVGAGHIATGYQPTFSEIQAGVRLIPVKFLFVGIDGGVAIGGGPGIDGALRIPEMRISAGAVPLSQRVLLAVGGELLMLGSNQGGEDVVDAGGAITADIRGPLGDKPLYLGGGFSVGYAVAPYVAGRVVIGVRIAGEGMDL